MAHLDQSNVYGPLSVFGDTKLKRDLELFGDFYIAGTKLTATITELNKLDGFTGTVDDLNYAKDLRATGVTSTEFDKLDGITTIGGALLKIPNVSAISFIRINADETITSRTAADFKTDLSLNNVANYGIATTLEAEDHTNNIKYMTPARTRDAINKVFTYNSSTGILIIDVT